MRKNHVVPDEYQLNSDLLANHLYFFVSEFAAKEW